ncbi:hypothetical protein [Saccharothrix hoggarensis]|uniref:Uncharacterized protein n=1 Tax=Saccharothrix hoggarensis TaxID=913853 RepID=A0ABW3QTW4_9PSEU
MTPAGGLIRGTEYDWATRGMFEFDVLLTHIGDEYEHGVTMFLSMPERIDVVSWGDGWSCEDTIGGIDCYHPELVVPDEAWPVLHFKAYPEAHIRDTIDVYATTADFEFAHEGVNYFNDTSL